jgi:hypothetical protein
MPADALVFVEVGQPGEQLARLIKMLGLVREPGGAAAPSTVIPLGDGVYFPEDFTVSPALVAELKKIHGVAAALTGLDDRGRPSGLLVVDPGTSDLLRGILETAVQVLEPAEAIEGYKTYRGADKKSWICVAPPFILVATSREQVVAAVGRSRDPKAESLASQSEFQAWTKDRQNSLVFLHINGPQVVKQLGPALKGKEAAIARGVLDLDHLESLVVTLGASGDKVELRAQLNLTTGHRNLAYSLARTAPLSLRSVAGVPEGVLGVVMIGLNRPSDAVSPSDRGPADGGVSALDLGRELFSNIEELSIFALPPSGLGPKDKPIPEFGVSLAVKDAAKSQALWNQLLALPALFGAPGVQAAGEIQIEGQPARLYQFGKGPNVVVASSSSGSMFLGTEAAVTASVKAATTTRCLSSDPGFRLLLGRLTSTTSKAVLVDVGRIVQLAAAAHPKDKDAAVAGLIFKDLKVSAITNEAPAQLSVIIQATGLPNVPSLIKTVSAARNQPPRDGRTSSPQQSREEGETADKRGF